MTCVGLARRCVIGVLFCLCASGCLPGADSQSDEKKEPHYLTGISLVGQMDYTGAIDAFEKSLEVNPRSASAHFELGCLYEARANDPAAAIYHYDRYLKYSPHPDQADIVRQHINSCKVELAKTVSAVGPLPSSAQRELERILVENKQLRDTATSLQSQLDQLRSTAARPAAVVTPPPQTPVPIPAPPRSEVPPSRAESPHLIAERSPTPSHPAGMRTYSIRAGDTPAALARKNGISLTALIAAKPQVNPTHLHVGQTLNIPAP